MGDGNAGDGNATEAMDSVEDGFVDWLFARLATLAMVTGVVLLHLGLLASGGCTTAPARVDRVEAAGVEPVGAVEAAATAAIVGEWDVFAPAPGMPMADYVSDETDGLILKLRPQAWPSVRDALASTLGGAVETRLADYLGSRLGLNLDFAHLDASRPSYLLFEPGAHDPWTACVQAGLPCSLIGEPAPAWGRLLVPATDPGALRAEIVGQLRYPQQFRLVAHESYVRVEFVLGPEVITEAVERGLEIRARYSPELDGARITPAKATLLEHDGAAGMYVDLSEGAALGAYLTSLKWHRAYRKAPVSKRLRIAFQGALARFSLDGRPAEAPRQPAVFEDAAVLLDGDGASVWMDVVQTRTRRGRQLRAEGRRMDVSLQPLLGVGRALNESPWPLTGRAAAALDDLLVAASTAATVHRRPEPSRHWAAVRLQIGSSEVGEPAVVDSPVNYRQPQRGCFAELAAIVRPVMQEAQTREDPWAYLHDALLGVTGRFGQKASECGVAGIGVQQKANWAVAAFDTWRAVAAWRSGHRQRARQLLEGACASGLGWACRAPDGRWPWTPGVRARR